MKGKGCRIEKERKAEDILIPMIDWLNRIVVFVSPPTVLSSSKFMDPKTSTPPTLVSHPPWLDLPVPLTEQILERLPLADYIRFAAVCPKWRSIQKDHRLRHAPNLPPMLVFPWLIPAVRDRPEITVCYHPDQDWRVCYSPFEERFYCLLHIPRKVFFASSHGWVAFQDFDCSPSSPGFLSILNPVSHVKIELPPLKVPPNYMSMSSTPDSPNCIIMFADGFEAFLWRVGDPNWTKLSHPNEHVITAYTSIFCKEKFYYTCFDGHLYIVDPLPTPTIQFLEMKGIQMPLPMNLDMNFLVESGGDILFVRPIRVSDEEYFIFKEFHVYKADLSRKVWVREECLGDRVLFLGENCSVSMLATDAGGRENCIYFPEHLVKFRRDWPPQGHFSIWNGFDLKTGRAFNGPIFPSTTTDRNYLDFKKYTLRWIIPRL